MTPLSSNNGSKNHHEASHMGITMRTKTYERQSAHFVHKLLSKFPNTAILALV